MAQQFAKKYDIFLSYSRKDDMLKGKNGKGWVECFKESLEKIHYHLTNRKLEIFYDGEEIENGNDWKFRLSKGINSSKLFLAFLSPNYLKSEHCRWEWQEYLRFAHFQSRGDDGLVRIYYAEVPGIPGSVYDEMNDPMDLLKIPEVKMFLKEQQEEQERIQLYIDNDKNNPDPRAYFDLRAWNTFGPDYLLELDVEERVKEIKSGFVSEAYPLFSKLLSINEHFINRLDRCLLADYIKGNINNPDKRFVGRHKELIAIHQNLIADKIGTVCSVNAMGGLGKTALALQYAHAYAEFYVAGGRWLVDCESKDNWYEALKEVFKNRGMEISDTEQMTIEILDDNQTQKDKLDWLFGQLETYCKKRASAVDKQFEKDKDKRSQENSMAIMPRMLLIMDNVTNAKFMSANQLNMIPHSEWLEIIVTSRLNAGDFGAVGNGTFKTIELSTLSLEEALCIFRQYQDTGNEKFYKDPEYEREIITLATELNGFTLGIVLAAAHLGLHETVRPNDYLQKLKDNGFDLLSELESNTIIGSKILSPDLKSEYRTEWQHKGIKAIIGFTFTTPGLLSEYEKRALFYCSFMHNENIVKHWIEKLLLADFPKLAIKDKSNEDPFITIWKNLNGLQLVRNSHKHDIVENGNEKVSILKMHIIVSDTIRNNFIDESLKQDLLRNTYLLFFTETKFLQPDVEEYIQCMPERITIIRLFNFFIGASLIKPKQIRYWVRFLHSLSAFDLHTLSTSNFEVLSAYCAKNYIEAKKNIEESFSETNPWDLRTFDSYIRYKCGFSRCLLHILRFHEEKTTYDELIAGYDTVIKLLDEAMAEHMAISKKYLSKNLMELNEVESDIYYLIYDLLFDYYDCLHGKAVVEEKFKKYEEAEILLTRVVTELSRALSTDDLKKYESALYHILINAQHSLETVKLRTGEYFSGITDLSTQIAHIERSVNEGLTIVAAEGYFRIANNLITSGNIEKALEMLYRSEKALIKSKGKISDEKFVYELIILNVKIVAYQFKLNKIGVGDFLHEYEKIIFAIDTNLNDEYISRFTREHFSSLLLANFISLINRNKTADDLSAIYNMVNVFMKRIIPFMEKDPVDWMEYILANVNFSKIYGVLLNKHEAAMVQLEDLWNKIPPHIKEVNQVHFMELTTIILPLHGILHHSIQLGDIDRLYFYLPIYGAYVDVLSTMDKTISGKFIATSKLFAEDYILFKRKYMEFSVELNELHKAAKMFNEGWDNIVNNTANNEPVSKNDKEGKKNFWNRFFKK